MKIAVLVKEVPDMEALVKVGADGRSVEVEKKRCLNYFDEIAVEAALRLKASAGGSVYAVTAGSGTGLDALRRALAMGCDEARFIDDPALKDASSLTVARALAALLKKEGFEIIFAGRQATDDEAGFMGPLVAEMLGIPSVAGITSFEAGASVTVTRETDRGTEKLETSLPALFSTEKGLYEPRVPQVMGLMKAMKAAVPKVTLAELGVEPAPALEAVSYRGPRTRPAVKMIGGDAAAASAELVRLLREEAKAL